MVSIIKNAAAAIDWRRPHPEDHWPINLSAINLATKKNTHTHTYGKVRSLLFLNKTS